MSDVFETASLKAPLANLEDAANDFHNALKDDDVKIEPADDDEGEVDDDGSKTEVPEKIDPAQKARDYGFPERVAYDYSVYSGNRKNAENGKAGEVPMWFGEAAVYEWNDEYGDIGPEVPELEWELFRNDYRMQPGNKIDAYQYKVTVEAPEPIHHVKRVGIPIYPLAAMNTDIVSSSTTWVFIQSFVRTLGCAATTSPLPSRCTRSQLFSAAMMLSAVLRPVSRSSTGHRLECTLTNCAKALARLRRTLFQSCLV